MEKRDILIIIISIIVLLTSPFLNAQNKASEEYTIKKGDTLWDISGSILEDNFLWPKLWEANPQIKNPDLIYPGDKIKIPTKEEIIRLDLPTEEPVPAIEPAPPVIEPEPVVEISEVKPVKYIVDKNRYIASGWISDEFPSIGQLIASPTERTIFGNYDTVYLKTDKDIADGDKFLAIRDVKTVRHPKTGERLGHQIRVTGIVEIIGIDNNIPKARIVSVFEELQIGDGILPYQELEPPVVPNVARTPDKEGYIVESYMNNKITSRGDIIYLDKGLDDGLEVGDIFSILSEKPVKRPVGALQILSLQPTSSTAVILNSEKEITIGDMWGN